MPQIKLGSPWLEQLNKNREITRLLGDKKTDVAVLGAGIAGVTTAYFLLKHTWRHVLLIEADKVAHGATGHNAGQLVSYFERPFSDIAAEFGFEMAGQGQRGVESAWELLEKMRRDLKLELPCLTFTGHAGCVDLKELCVHLKNNEVREKAGLEREQILVSDSFKDKKKIPRAFRRFYTVVSHEAILDVLQTNDKRYIATLSAKKGVMNSARFCEEAVTAMLKKYRRRLTLVEHTPVSKVLLHEKFGELISGRKRIFAKRIILCTNGFERFKIENLHGANIDTKFHHLVRGSVGYMAAFMETPPMPPSAISYLPAHTDPASGAYDSDPYFYVTRRPYGEEDKKDLVCVGGPEALLDDTNDYSRAHPYPNEARDLIDAFVKKTYRHAGTKLKYTHLWHGLMGYTPNGIRCVGTEPCNPVLLYNLGCNGVGILPSIYGGFRISQIIKGKKLGPSIFDPADLRCLMPEKKEKKEREKKFWHRFFFWRS